MKQVSSAIDELTHRARIAAACGALAVPGDRLDAAAEAVGSAWKRWPRLGSEARLDRLILAGEVASDRISPALDAAGLGHQPVLALLAATHPVAAELRVTTDQEGRTTAAVRVPVDLRLGEAVARLADAGADTAFLDDVAPALGLTLVEALTVQLDPSPTWGAAFVHTVSASSLSRRADALRAACEAVGASSAQARWHVALLEALGAPRGVAPVEVREDRLIVRYEDVDGETALRFVEAFHPRPDSGARLGALAGAGVADTALVEAHAHPSEPPTIDLLF